MKAFNTILAIFLVSLGVNSLSMAVTLCPNADLKESLQDCPWAGVARALIQTAQSSPEKVPKQFEIALPEITSQLQADAQLGTFMDLWGQSINYDEYAKGEIVNPAILKSIYSLDQVDRPVTVDPLIRGSIERAGLEHTYGYLFSVLSTPFGYKRARWVQGEIEQGFQLPKQTLSPLTQDGSLFANVTYFAGSIAFLNDEYEFELLQKDSGSVSKEITDFDYSQLSFTRVEETVQIAERKIVLRTDLVPFQIKPTDKRANSTLLIYSIFDSLLGARLITAFPVQTSFGDGLVKPGTLGDSQEITTRYNAYINGLSGKKILGNRKVVSLKIDR